MHNYSPIPNAETIVVKVNNNQAQTFGFEDNYTFLERKKIIGFSIQSSTAVNSINNRPLVADAEVRKSYLTLVTGEGIEIFKNIPMDILLTMSLQGHIFRIQPAVIRLNKSYIKNFTSTNIPNNSDFQITFYYETN